MESNKFSIENDIELVELMPESGAPLSLETLNSDCQQLILDYFKWKDLLNVAETSKNLNAAACLAFKRKYGQRVVRITDLIGNSRVYGK